MTHIFVDVDNTLVSTLPWEMAHCVEEGGHRIHRLARLSAAQLQADVCGPSDKVVKSRGTYISRLRPGAAAFLAELGRIGPVSALSHGKSTFVTAVMKAHGLDGFFVGMYGREDYDRVPQEKGGILIDDKSPFDPLSVQKLLAYGALRASEVRMGSNFRLPEVVARQYVQVAPFEGDLHDVLLGALEHVGKLLSERRP
jgi:hypothetical protein